MPGTDLISMASSGNPVGAGVQAGMNLLQSGLSYLNLKKAEKEAKKLKKTRPRYDIPVEAQEGLDLAESELAGGMSARAENAYNQLQDRQFSASLGAILKGGGSVNEVSEVFDSSEAGRLRLAQLEDQLRLTQIGNLMNQQKYMAEQKDKKFEFNEWGPWADEAQANAEARRSATAGIWSGLQGAGSAAMNYAEGRSAANMYNDYFGAQPGMRASSVFGVSPSENLSLPRTEIPGSPSFNPMQQPYVPFNPAIQPRPMVAQPYPYNFPQYNQLF